MGAAPSQNTTDPAVLAAVQQLFLYKHFSMCCMLFVNFQGSEMVDFDNLSSFIIILGREDLVRSSLGHSGSPTMSSHFFEQLLEM